MACYENIECQIRVFQDFGKYAASVKENIAFGNINDILNINKIEDVAIKSGSSEFISKLERLYDTELTRIFDENGIDLSGGQWQKIAIARMLFSVSSLRILDEPTASLDPNSEYEFYKLLKENSENYITILVSHRLSSVKLATKIVYMEDGKVVECGEHTELMKLNSKYASLYKKYKEYN